jgi:predicted kinase
MSRRERPGRERPEAGRLIVLCGLPGSGKSTLARRMAVDQQAVGLSPDEWMASLGVDLWDVVFRTRIESLQWELAQELLRSGRTVVIEWGVWSRVERDVVRLRARELGASVDLHYLDVPIDELWRRVHERNREDPPIQRSELEQWAGQIEVPDDAERRLYDAPLRPAGRPGRRRPDRPPARPGSTARPTDQRVGRSPQLDLRRGVTARGRES